MSTPASEYERINDEFEAKSFTVEARPVTKVTLWRNGQPIRDTHGNVKFYDSMDEAREIATNWERHRAPTYAELKAMSDEDLIRRAYPDPPMPLPRGETEALVSGVGTPRPHVERPNPTRITDGYGRLIGIGDTLFEKPKRWWRR